MKTIENKSILYIYKAIHYAMLAVKWGQCWLIVILWREETVNRSKWSHWRFCRNCVTLFWQELVLQGAAPFGVWWVSATAAVMLLCNTLCKQETVLPGACEKYVQVQWWCYCVTLCVAGIEITRSGPLHVVLGVHTGLQQQRGWAQGGSGCADTGGM